jgi:hypothetical protein
LLNGIDRSGRTAWHLAYATRRRTPTHGLECSRCCASHVQHGCGA